LGTPAGKNFQQASNAKPEQARVAISKSDMESFAEKVATATARVVSATLFVGTESIRPVNRIWSRKVNSGRIMAQQGCARHVQVNAAR